MRYLVLLISLVGMLTACRNGSEASMENQWKARVDSDPRQAIHHIDSLLQSSSKTYYSEAQQLELRQLRQQAFSTLGEEDSVLEEAMRIQIMADHLNDSLAYALALLPVKGDFEESKFKYLEDTYPLAIGILGRRKLPREQGKLMSAEAAMLNNLGQYEASQRLAMEAIALPGLQERDTLRAALYHTIANNFLGINTMDQARVYFWKALDLARDLNDSLMQSKIFMDLGILHYNMRTDSARHHYQQAIDILPRERGKLQRLKILYNISVQDFEGKRNAEALAGFRYLLNVSQKEKLPTGEVVAYKALGFYHEANGDPDSAVSYLERSIQLADSIGQTYMKIQGLFELSKAYRTAGQEEKAFALHQETDAIQDSLQNVDTKNVIHGLEMRFNTERMSLENKSLRKDLYIRQGWIIVLSLLTVGFVALVWLYWQRTRLIEARANSYAVLMERYKAEKMAIEAAMLRGDSPVVEILNPVTVGKRPAKDASVSDPLYVELQHLFQVKSVYKDPKLRIEEVAQWLNVSPRQISASLRERESATFTQYVNSHRIREARRIMEDPSSASLKLEAIGEMAGIPTRSYFNKLFQSIVGVTPGHYRRNILGSASDGADGTEG